MRGFLKEGGLGGASFLESCLCPHPVPALRPECLCFPRLRWFSVDPGVGLEVLDLVRALVGYRKEKLLPGAPGTAPDCRWGPLDGFWGIPRTWGSPILSTPHPASPSLLLAVCCVWSRCYLGICRAPRRLSLGWAQSLTTLALSEG